MPTIKWFLRNKLFNPSLLPSEPTETMVVLVVTMSPVPSTRAGPFLHVWELVKVFSV